MKYLSIKSFDKHQHYKDRRPPWIKLHAEILDDYEFLCLQDASKAHLMLLWVLASKLDNRIPYDLTFLSRKLGTTSPVDVEELVLQGFVEVSQDDSKPLARRKQSAMLETETETEKKLRPAIADGGVGVPDPPSIPRPPSWPAEGAELWAAKVGPIAVPRFGKAVKPMVDQYGWERTRAAMLAYIELTDRTRKVEWFVGDAVKWVALGEMPLVDPETGNLTERGEIAMRQARRAAS